MTNRLSLWLGLLILGFVAYDLSTGSGMLLFLARKLEALVQFVAFWR